LLHHHFSYHIDMDNYQIRKMTREELDIAIKWAGIEGWNPGIYDAEAFYAADPDGFFIGLLNDKPISCISAVSYGEKVGFLGLYIVRQGYRGRGFGLKIWNKALEYLNTQNIGLDGVVAQQENYKKSGFKLAYRNIRFQGISKKSGINIKVVDLHKVPFNQLLEYDSCLFPAPRPKFLEKWINLPESAAFGFIKEGKLYGYSVVRKCINGFKIGPLFADNTIVAEQLFLAVNNFLPPETAFFLDIPEINLAAMQLVKKYNMQECFETARMYTKGSSVNNLIDIYGYGPLCRTDMYSSYYLMRPKEAPSLPVDKIFGVTTFELG
jgi:hypothetical protein